MINDSYDVAKAFQRIEDRLISSLKHNLIKHFNEEKLEDMNWSAWQTEQLKSLELFKKRNKKLFKSEFNTINYDIRQFLTKNFEDSRLSQENLILESIENGNFSTQNKKINKLWNIYKTSKNKRIKKKQLTRIFKETSNLEASFFKIDEKKLKQLIKETTENMKRAENSILRYTEDQYRKIIFDAQVFANTGAGTVQQAVDMATKDFLSKGINCIQYANGAMVNIKSYAEMAVRTANSRAHLYGEGEKRSKWGVHTVLVPNRGGGCPYCIKFQGKVFIDDIYSRGTIKEANELNLPLLSSAVKQRLFHPNCKDTVVTYFSGTNSEVIPPTKEELSQKITNYKKEQKIRYIDRQIDKYKRLELGSIDSENIEKYHQKRLEWQHYKRELKENDKMFLNELNIPSILEKTIRQQNQILNKNAEIYINNNLTDKDIKQEKLDKVPFTYRKEDDKIIIDPEHKDIVYYNIDESIVHEIIHMKDIREGITDNNLIKLCNIKNKAKMYIDNNYNYFYNYVQKYPDNMAFGDIMSALSKGTLPVGIGHEAKYWKNENIIINELAANLLSSKIIGNNAVDELLEEIPPLKDLREEFVKLWHI